MTSGGGESSFWSSVCAQGISFANRRGKGNGFELICVDDGVHLVDWWRHWKEFESFVKNEIFV